MPKMANRNETELHGSQGVHISFVKVDSKAKTLLVVFLGETLMYLRPVRYDRCWAMLSSPTNICVQHCS